MKILNSIKNLAKVLVAGAALIASTHGATLSYTGLSLTSESVITNGVAVNSIVFVNPNNAAVTVALFDTPSTNLTFTIGAYTNQSVTVGTVVTSITNVLGVVNNTTNTLMTTSYTPVSASTNNYNKLIFLTINTNSTVTFAPAAPVVFNQGIAVTNSATNVTQTITYSRLR